MKKVITILLSAMLILASSDTTKAQNCVQQGNFIIAGFYGYPYIFGAIIKTASQNVNNVKNLNHIGGKAEYMITDKIGLGAEVTYARVGGSYQDDSTLLWYTAEISKIRVLPKMNVHFGTTESIDPYFTVGAGYKSTNIYLGGPNNSLDINNFNLVPLSMRIGIGLHYFFTDNIGINAEVGLGGPAIQVGLAAKF